MKSETHPLKPFLPQNAKILMLGSFPPPQQRWSMEFFYPNWINDMWRIIGHIFYNDKRHFELAGEKRFDKEAIESFCKERGIALYDTAREVFRLRENASDKFLEIIKATDVSELIGKLPSCTAIVTTGQKATDEITKHFHCEEPQVGEMREIIINGKSIRFWRMPSTSRAYPLPLEKKAETYKNMLTHEEIYSSSFE